MHMLTVPFSKKYIAPDQLLTGELEYRSKLTFSILHFNIVIVTPTSLTLNFKCRRMMSVVSWSRCSSPFFVSRERWCKEQYQDCRRISSEWFTYGAWVWSPENPSKITIFTKSRSVFKEIFSLLSDLLQSAKPTIVVWVWCTRIPKNQ